MMMWAQDSHIGHASVGEESWIYIIARSRLMKFHEIGRTHLQVWKVGRVFDL